MSWKDSLKLNQEAVLVTCSKTGEPNGVYVNLKGLVDNKILINACQMDQTLKNIKENNRVCVITKYNSEYYRIKGRVSLHTSGKYYELAKERNVGPELILAITVDIDEVFDLENVKKIELK
jgi:general stress protein 26